MTRLQAVLFASTLTLISVAACSIRENPEKAARKTVGLYLELVEFHAHDSEWIDKHASLLDHPHYDWLGGNKDYPEIGKVSDLPEGYYFFKKAKLDSLTKGNELVDFSRDASPQDAFFAKINYQVVAGNATSRQEVFQVPREMYEYVILAIDKEDGMWKIIGGYPGAKVRFVSVAYYLKNSDLYGFNAGFRDELAKKFGQE